MHVVPRKRTWIRRFYALLKELSTEDHQTISLFSVAIFTLFISGLCLQKYTFNFDVTGYMNETHIYVYTTPIKTPKNQSIQCRNKIH
jgi:hypothetical protein